MKKFSPSDVVTTQQKATKFILKALPIVSMISMIACVLAPAFATDYRGKVEDLIGNIINIVCFVVVGIGVFMTIWGVVGMIMSAKQEDTNAQTQASQKLMVGIALIALPIAIKALNLDDLIMSAFDDMKTDGGSNGGSNNGG